MTAGRCECICTHSDKKTFGGRPGVKKGRKKSSSNAHFRFESNSPRPVAVQMEQYRHRTTLDLRGLIRGNVSVQISSVKMSDRGDYTCLIPRLKPRCIITLHVVEQRNQVSAAPPLENISTSNQPGKGAVAAIVVVAVVVCLLIAGAVFIRRRRAEPVSQGVV
ncbi:unnamed protein product [Pleuronectes platessa]|uniref:Immunoglobulin V-set domain-containing protein n=1 Tax=Pleuronectes platessa TaxID=8262 RepID=A0A9N7TRU8_PLEPL|nr:unnamed protein product [Pleuronectes platessa]